MCFTYLLKQSEIYSQLAYVQLLWPSVLAAASENANLVDDPFSSWK